MVKYGKKQIRTRLQCIKDIALALNAAPMEYHTQQNHTEPQEYTERAEWPQYKTINRGE